jgi:phage FluMu protein Com
MLNSNFCPGAKDFRQPKPISLKCPFCGELLEIWTDEVKTICPKCKKIVFKEMPQSCVDWCKYAKSCLGEELYQKYLDNKKIKPAKDE